MLQAASLKEALGFPSTLLLSEEFTIHMTDSKAKGVPLPETVPTAPDLSLGAKKSVLRKTFLVLANRQHVQSRPTEPEAFTRCLFRSNK